MQEKLRNFLKIAVYEIEYSKEVIKDWKVYGRGGLVMSSLLSGHTLITSNLSEYEKKLLDRYSKVVLDEGKPDKQPINIVFPALDSSAIPRFEDVVFTRGKI